jgi:hypothetical protein
MSKRERPGYEDRDKHSEDDNGRDEDDWGHEENDNDGGDEDEDQNHASYNLAVIVAELH